DIRWEFAVLDSFNVFAVAQPVYKDLLDEWVQNAPESWVPLLARANYFISQGWRARGMKLAKDTSPEQFRRMDESFRLALPDLEPALRINAHLFYAYLLLMRINRGSGDQERGTVLVQKALEVSPNSYLVRAYHMYLLSPRWGGSHEAMQEFAADSMLHAAKNP